MKLTPRSLLWISIVVLLVAVAAGGWLLFQEPVLESRRLPDGTTLSLATVTFGTRHECDARSGWERLLATVRPGTGADSRHTWNTPYPAQTWWLRARMPNYPGASFFGLNEWLLTDEHGCPFGGSLISGAGYNQWSPALPAPVPEEWYALSFSNYPRRTGRVFLRILNNRFPFIETASFALTNEWAGIHPHWIAPPYPIVRRSGDVDFVLRGIRHDESGLLRMASADIRAWDLKHPGEQWEPAAVTVSDATGNVLSELAATDPETGRTRFRGLCIREAAWKLRMVLARPARTRLSPDYEWVFRGVPVPGHLSRLAINRQAQAGPIALRLVRANTLGSRSNRQGKPITLLELNVYVPKVRDGLRLSLHEVNGQNAESLFQTAGLDPLQYPSYLTGVASLRSAGNFSFHVPLHSGTKRISLRFAGYRSRTVEFLAKP
ncbi:MAG TPA: hypothetical protein VK689_10405 [Armatimonadota bacterium]|nr:hypothetical protein [Armatimonadota bacterium]